MKYWGALVWLLLSCLSCYGDDSNEPLYVVVGDFNEIAAGTRFEGVDPSIIPVKNGRITYVINDDGTCDMSRLFLEVDLRVFSPFHDKFNNAIEIVVLVRFNKRGIYLQSLYEAFEQEKHHLNVCNPKPTYQGNPFMQRVTQYVNGVYISSYSNKIWNWTDPTIQHILVRQMCEYFNKYK